MELSPASLPIEFPTSVPFEPFEPPPIRDAGSIELSRGDFDYLQPASLETAVAADQRLELIPPIVFTADEPILREANAEFPSAVQVRILDAERR
jgi:hypothetical protein